MGNILEQLLLFGKPDVKESNENTTNEANCVMFTSVADIIIVHARK